METQLALITAEHAYLRSGSGEKDGSNRTGIEDEIFSGWAVEKSFAPGRRVSSSEASSATYRPTPSA